MANSRRHLVVLNLFHFTIIEVNALLRTIRDLEIVILEV